MTDASDDAVSQEPVQPPLPPEAPGGYPGYPASGQQQAGQQSGQPTPGYPAAPPYGQAPYGQAPAYPAPGQAPAYPAPDQAPAFPAPGQAAPAPYGQAPYAQASAPYGQAPYGQAPYGQPPYGQAPYGQAPYGAAPYGYPPISGRRFWALLFLFYIPYLGVLAAPIVAIIQRASAQRSPHPIVRENARWAANWALSYALYLIALVILSFTVGIATARPTYSDYGSYRSEPTGWLALPLLLLAAVGIYSLVTIIRGSVRSDRFVHRPVLAIPFFRA